MAVREVRNAAQREKNDGRLEAAVRRAILSYEPLRAFDCPMTVQVQDGRVQLKGTVRTVVMKHMAGELARDVAGVREVQNDLVSDSELEIQVARSLAKNPRTRLLTTDITIKSFLGIVYLRGRVTSSAVKEAAGQVAGQVAGVREVVNDLVVSD